MDGENEVEDLNIKEVQGELFVENDFPDVVILGVKVVSTMNIINATDTDFNSGMIMTYPFGENLEFISVNSSKGSATAYANQIIFTMEKFLKKESVFITLKFMPKKKGNIENTVNIYSGIGKEVVVKSTVIDLESKIDGVGDKVDTVGNGVTQVSGTVNAVKSAVGQVGVDVNTVGNGVTQVSGTVNAVKSAVGQVGVDVNTVGNGVAQVLGTVNAVKSAVGQVGVDVNTVGNGVAQVLGTVNAVKSAVGQVGVNVNTVENAVGQVGNSVNAVGNAVTQVGGSISTVGDNVNVIGSAVTQVGENINLLIKKADGTESSAIKDIKNMVADIENKVGTIISPEVYKLTTGIVVKDFNANSLVVEIKNTTKSEVTIKIGLVDQTSVLEQTRYRTLNIQSKSCKNFIFGDVPLEYEVIFEGIREGVYLWTSTRTSDAFTSVNLSNFIGSNTFSHNDLFIKKDIVE